MGGLAARWMMMVQMHKRGGLTVHPILEMDGIMESIHEDIVYGHGESKIARGGGIRARADPGKR